MLEIRRFDIIKVVKIALCGKEQINPQPERLSQHFETSFGIIKL